MPDPGEPRWFHVIVHTYAAWLHGDPRGFRTRHHREHVDGDYKRRPPAGTHDRELARSRESLVQPPVTVPPEWRPVVGAEFAHRLIEVGAQVICLSMGGRHLHTLAKMPPGDVPRAWVGVAKKHTAFVVKRHGWQGKLWGVRGGYKPVADRDHQTRAFRYILRHAGEGAWVWNFRDGPPPV